ncbi:GMC oxidoreductase [Pholiota conissans]|uniref:pyranose dehydrogenase (acceptor) n=1 Tax=Pholiota conissans TaxID=109636 RepID=A0A9P5Z070_9AGAR|nr:GMC oxidoreductase [Pholiota conissans]
MTKRLAVLLLLAVLESSCTTLPRNLYVRDIITQDDVQQSYDYIIAGGGTAGLVVASRLSENADTTVLVVETGLTGDDVASSINPPDGAFYSSIVGTDYDWQHVTVSQPNLNNRVVSWPRGKVLGGSSAMNAMYQVRPSTTEMDAWNEINGIDPSSTGGDWGWDSMYAYMKKSENFVAPNDALLEYLPIAYNASSYGSGGPMQVSYPQMMINIVSNWTSSLAAAGIPPLLNPNSGTTLGGFITPSSINPSNWTRSYSRSAYIDPLPPRSNLHILPGTTLVRIVLSNATDGSGNLYATGVEFAQNGAAPRVTVGVKKEVILAGGALGSPKVLMLSGVGPKDVLANASVPLLLELPGVGQHLQDHLTAGVVWNTAVETAGSIHDSNSDFSKTPEFMSVINDAVAFVNSSALFNGGSVSDFQNQILAALNDSAATLVPSQDASIVEGYKAVYQTLANTFLPDVAQIEMLMSIVGSGSVTIQSAIQHPFSRGRTYINSNNPFDPIIIDPQYYSHFADVIIMRQGIKLVRQVGAAFGALFEDETSPGPNIQTDADIDNWLVQNGAGTQYHPTASCSMLPKDQGGVVDRNLLVYGLGNVRVADASIFPFEFAAHLQSATYGVGEQAADLIKGSSYTVPTSFIAPFAITYPANSSDKASDARYSRTYPSYILTLVVIASCAFHYVL